MELVLLLIAAGVIFYLYKTFQTYLSNPIAPNDKDVLQVQNSKNAAKVQAPPPTPKEKLKNTEYGILTRILGRLSYADSKSCILEEKLVKGIIQDMASDMDYPESLFFEIYKEASNENIRDLATLFADETIAQYKKRLKVVEFMFALSYADGVFNKDEEDCIIDVAAILEIENDDFNKLYDEFKAINEKNAITMSANEAIEILHLKDNFTREELDKKYDEAVANKRQNIFDPKNLAKPYNEFVGDDLKKVSQAYAILLPLVKDSKIESKETNEDSTKDLTKAL